MLRASTRTGRRHGIAAVEMAVLAVPLFILLLGVWEVGRMIHVTQIIANASREGARLAAQGVIIYYNPTNDGFKITNVYTYTQSDVNIPTVVSRVRNYLTTAGIDVANITDANLVTYTNNFQTPLATPPNPMPDPPPDPNEPWGASKNDRLSVTVTVPYANFRWTGATLLNPTSLSVTVDGFALRDSWFTVNENLPTWKGF